MAKKGVIKYANRMLQESLEEVERQCDIGLRVVHDCPAVFGLACILNETADIKRACVRLNTELDELRTELNKCEQRFIDREKILKDGVTERERAMSKSNARLRRALTRLVEANELPEIEENMDEIIDAMREARNVAGLG